MDYFEFVLWFFQGMFFLMGVLTGVGLTLLSAPAAWRFHRRIRLRRNWINDRPRPVTEGLFPEWQDYEPDIPGIAKKCVCHGRQIHPGERVLTWPETGPMGLLHVAVYCESVQQKLWENP